MVASNLVPAGEGVEFGALFVNRDRAAKEYIEFGRLLPLRWRRRIERATIVRRMGLKEINSSLP